MEPKLTGYVGTNLIVLGNASQDTVGGACVNVGGKIENKGFYAQAEGGYGTASYAKAEIGKNFTFGDSGFGANTSVGGQYTVSNRTKDYYKTKFEDGANSPTWNANDTRGYAQVALTYNNPTIEVGLGVRGGIKTSTQPSLDGITLANVGETKGTEYAGRTTKSFAELRPSVGVNFGNGWKIALQAGIDKSGLNNGQLGLSLNF